MSHDVAANGLDTWASKHGATLQIGCHNLSQHSTIGLLDLKAQKGVLTSTVFIEM